MTWKVRHEGSPRAVEGLTLEQVAQGLVDGQWEPTDEVQGPGEADWTPIENHPQLAEVAAEIEPPPPAEHGDETHLDFNPLIDVCLVLLVFFILTTSYAALQKRLEAPTVDKSQPKIPVYTKEQVAETMIVVKASMEGDQPVIRVEDQVVEPDKLVAALRSYVRGTKKNMLLFEHTDDVPQETVVQVIDDAKGAGIDRVRLLVP
jgi:biopolymer transport protein ExbD